MARATGRVTHAGRQIVYTIGLSMCIVTRLRVASAADQPTETRRIWNAKSEQS